MKKKLFVLIMLLLSLGSLMAQDVITTKSGQEIQAKILEITSNEIKYKRFDYQDGPTYILNKSEVLMITYPNGESEAFSNTHVVVSSTPNTDVIVKEGMKYKEYEKLYDYQKYVRQYDDLYDPALSGFASFLVPGLGQGLCDEWGRGALHFVTNILGYTATYLWYQNYLNDYYYGRPTSISATWLAFSAALTLTVDIYSIVDATRIAKIKNMYNQDIKGKQSYYNVNISPSVTYLNTPGINTSTVGLLFTINF